MIMKQNEKKKNELYFFTYKFGSFEKLLGESYLFMQGAKKGYKRAGFGKLKMCFWKFRLNFKLKLNSKSEIKLIHLN